ncbi:hypothetical protein PGT21_010823 [Puccinia graminis f. sp. tritici]|uniref:Uncharacterized protein n=1 Tax=Puccinia graminis f. sp. tritici TaxID=56615 RepID=A0A5B0NDW3_PUCGR|nr:hypothetical protein PGT21_010823 [Puccinia graminis f. sp. tritici]
MNVLAGGGWTHESITSLEDTEVVERPFPSVGVLPVPAGALEDAETNPRPEETLSGQGAPARRALSQRVSHLILSAYPSYGNSPVDPGALIQLMMIWSTGQKHLRHADIPPVAGIAVALEKDCCCPAVSLASGCRQFRTTEVCAMPMGHAMTGMAQLPRAQPYQLQ